MFTSEKDIVNAASAKTGIAVKTVPDIRNRSCRVLDSLKVPPWVVNATTPLVGERLDDTVSE